MYLWWRFVHIAAALAFVMAHGTAVGVAFRIRGERNRERIAALLELSSRSLVWMYLSLGALVVAGVVLGFMTRAWGRGWIWTAIALLVLLMVLMYALAATFYRRVRDAVTSRRGSGYRISDEELEDILSSGRPHLLALVGFGGLLGILWLMVFRPF
ncbi:MAG TPA: hypothetical protein VM638_08200 [Actinomycetota bacterium]|nr:hypothetical protein [Actinomycetota bacterium]